MFMWHVGDIAEKKKCKTGQHEKMAIFNESNPDSYRSIYGSLFSEFGEEITTKIHRAYAGRQISFPKKLYTEEYINYYVQKNKSSGECMAFDGKVKSYEVKSGKLESYKRKGSGYTLRSNCRVFDLISKAGMKFFLKSFHLFF